MLETLRSLIRFRRFERSADARRLARAANIADLRRMAKKRLPGGVFDYIDGAAEDELTYRRNSSAFSEFEFRPRVLRDVSGMDTTTTLFGEQLSFPLIVAPMGFVRIAHPLGELALAAGAEKAGVPFSLSTLGTRSIEEVAAAGSGNNWFQVYVWKDRTLVKELLDRARDAQYRAIAITVDTAVLGRRERDVRRGFTLPPAIGLDTLLQGGLHPSWTWELLRSEPIRFANVSRAEIGDGVDAINLAAYTQEQFDPSLSWADIDWFRSNWDGPIVIKGVQSVDDARRAVDAGVNSVCISNHGGRQLDGAPAPVELIEPIVQALGGAVPVISDGGVRRGSDIVKAIALGADAVMVGRPFFYGLGAAGRAGVDFAFDFLHAGMRQVMALNGVTSLKGITREMIRHRPSEPLP